MTYPRNALSLSASLFLFLSLSRSASFFLTSSSRGSPGEFHWPRPTLWRALCPACHTDAIIDACTLPFPIFVSPSHSEDLRERAITPRVSVAYTTIFFDHGFYYIQARFFSFPLFFHEHELRVEALTRSRGCSNRFATAFLASRSDFGDNARVRALVLQFGFKFRQTRPCPREIIVLHNPSSSLNPKYQN